jgi:LmbE family N-acetylglucosaminyl deacetylase
MMNAIDPALTFKGKIVVMVPHMDDGVLACGGTIAKLPDRDCVHVVYATDGMASPAPVMPWRDFVSKDLGAARIDEAKAAMGYLGVPDSNIFFLNLADGGLKRQSDKLRTAIAQLLDEIKPARVFVPFRYDCHTDHLALHRVVTALLPSRPFETKCYEYFVYYRFRLLPQRDVRNYIDPVHLDQIDISDVSDRKRKALDCFKSQTTIYYTWQARPNLSSWLLDEVSQSPEVFLRHDPALPGPAVFKNHAGWIRLVHTLEPILKKRKDQVVALLQRGIIRNDRIADRS